MESDGDFAFMGGSIDDDDDEDYSEAEDIKKNAKNYNLDDEILITKNTEPLTMKELEDLITESKQSIPDMMGSKWNSSRRSPQNDQLD